jgi:uncharacterized protein YqeY
MTLHETIKEEIKTAMRAKDALRLEVLRGISSAFTNEVIAGRKPPTELLDLPKVGEKTSPRKNERNYQ